MNFIDKNERDLDSLSIAVLRALLIDEINTAKSGHPGMALDIAPALFALYKYFLVADPEHPEWFNRDRFVLSSGHNSALLYALLHLCGYGISIDDLKAFRQLGSRTPGHPEIGVTPGVDATSGPLGQGIAQAVGMAMAEKKIAASYPEGERLCSHFTYCLCGDGCLEEGISQEAISLAGKMRLNKLILIYDANLSTLDEPTKESMDEDVKLRFMASKWNVLEVKDGNDADSIASAIAKARKSASSPTLIVAHTKIGYGTSLEGSHLCHGAPLGEEEGKKAKAFYGYDEAPFGVPGKVYDNLSASFGKRGKEAYMAYQKNLEEYRLEYPEAYDDFIRSLNRDVAAYSFEDPVILDKNESTRSASGRFLNALVKAVPFTFGGSADVASSVKTAIKGEKNFSSDEPNAKNIAFGIREFIMASASNGIALHKGLLPYCGSFMIFSDYMRSAIRMSALEDLPVIYLLSHDSLAVGEDGPTHEPVEQLSSLRLIPGLRVYRPADARETFAAWRIALQNKEGPIAIVLSRQDLPNLSDSSYDGVTKGAYLIKKAENPTISLLASGSEVSLAFEAASSLEKEGERVDIVSVPEFKGIEKMSEEEQKSLFRVPYEKRFAIEMGSPDLWYRYAKHVKGVSSFGSSGKAKDVLSAYGFDINAVAAWISSVLSR